MRWGCRSRRCRASSRSWRHGSASPTTRRITVTEAGSLFLERARDILSDIENAEDAARGLDSLRGIVRLAIPVVYGTREIIPRLPKFLAMHPQLRVELAVADDRQDLVAEGADVAIRMGELDDSSFGARRLAALRRLVVASPAYLKAHGVPKTPADLASHDCIFGPGSFGRDRWSFTRNGTEISIDVRGRISTGSGPGLFACVDSRTRNRDGNDRDGGTGNQDRCAGRAVARLRTAAVDVHAVFPGGPRPSAKVRALVDYLAAELKPSR